MKKYTRKQIEESIKHWQGILKKMNESVFDDGVSIGTVNNIDTEPEDEMSPILIGDDVTWISGKEPISKLLDQLDDGQEFSLMIHNYIIKCQDAKDVQRAIDYFHEGEKKVCESSSSDKFHQLKLSSIS